MTWRAGDSNELARLVMSTSPYTASNVTWPVTIAASIARLASNGTTSDNSNTERRS